MISTDVVARQAFEDLNAFPASIKLSIAQLRPAHPQSQRASSVNRGLWQLSDRSHEAPQITLQKQRLGALLHPVPSLVSLTSGNAMMHGVTKQSTAPERFTRGGVCATLLVRRQLIEQVLQLVSQQRVESEPTGAARTFLWDQEGVVALKTFEKVLASRPEQFRAQALVKALHRREFCQSIDVPHRSVFQDMLVEVFAEVLRVANAT